MLELTYRIQIPSGIIPVAVRYLVKSEATLKSILVHQYIHFEHDNFGIVIKLYCMFTRKILFYDKQKKNN